VSLVAAPLALPVILACELIGKSASSIPVLAPCLVHGDMADWRSGQRWRIRLATICPRNLDCDKGNVSDYLGITLENNVPRGMYTKIKVAKVIDTRLLYIMYGGRGNIN
jgi:hypothetical protein